MYSLLRKTLVAIYWMHLRMNLIYIKSFLPTKKPITAHCLLGENFRGNVAIFNVYE